MGQARGGQSVELIGGGDVHAFPMDSQKRPAFVMLPFLHIGLPSSLETKQETSRNQHSRS